MKNTVLTAFFVLLLASSVGCTNLSRTQQGFLSGAAAGALAGVGIASVAGGSGTVGALVGAGAGGVLGGAYAGGYLNEAGF